MSDDRELQETQQQIIDICDGIKNLLLEKNRNYGNSAIKPKRIFSKATAIEQIFVRIDDKLSRIEKVGVNFAQGDESAVDTVRDLIGYLVLLLVAMSMDRKNWLHNAPVTEANATESATEGLLSSGKSSEPLKWAPTVDEMRRMERDPFKIAYDPENDLP